MQHCLLKTGLNSGKMHVEDAYRVGFKSLGQILKIKEEIVMSVLYYTNILVCLIPDNTA